MDDRTLEYGDLMSLKNVAIIIPGESWKEWHQQAGCVACLHPSCEGWLEILWNVPTDNFGCATWDMDRLRMARDLLEYAGSVIYQIIDIEGFTEAWLNIAFTLSPEYLATHPEIPYGPSDVIHGILTYENCD